MSEECRLEGNSTQSQCRRGQKQLECSGSSCSNKTRKRIRPWSEANDCCRCHSIRRESHSRSTFVLMTHLCRFLLLWISGQRAQYLSIRTQQHSVEDGGRRLIFRGDSSSFLSLGKARRRENGGARRTCNVRACGHLPAPEKVRFQLGFEGETQPDIWRRLDGSSRRDLSLTPLEMSQGGDPWRACEMRIVRESGRLIHAPSDNRAPEAGSF